MYKIRLYFYEITSISLGFALLTFFGTLSFLPVEIMLMGEGQTWLITFIILSLSAIIAFILLSFLKREFSLIIMRIFDIFSTFFAIIAVISFLIFTRDMLEPWLIQGAWFLRYNGVIMSLLLGSILIKTAAGLSFIISKFNEPEEKMSQEQLNIKEKKLELLTFLIVVLTFSFYIIEVLLFRYFTLLNVLLSIVIFHICLLVGSLYLLSKNKYNNFLKIKFFQIINITQKPNDKQLKDTATHENKNKLEQQRRFFYKIKKKLTNSGTNVKDFWWLFIPLFFIALLCIIALILYPFELYINFSFPYSGNIIEVNLLLIQILAY
ncbi:MAG: hypothetical protein ACTSQJ_14120, partial [Promethearchaeota archaeon]